MAFIFASVFVFHHKQHSTSLELTTQREKLNNFCPGMSILKVVWLGCPAQQ